MSDKWMERGEKALRHLQILFAICSIRAYAKELADAHQLLERDRE